MGGFCPVALLAVAHVSFEFPLQAAGAPLVALAGSWFHQELHQMCRTPAASSAGEHCRTHPAIANATNSRSGGKQFPRGLQADSVPNSPPYSLPLCDIHLWRQIPKIQIPGTPWPRVFVLHSQTSVREDGFDLQSLLARFSPKDTANQILAPGHSRASPGDQAACSIG